MGFSTILKRIILSEEIPYNLLHLKSHTGTKTTGTVVNAHDHYPFGKRMPARIMVTDAEGNRYQFTGHEFDEETGFDYHGARYYNRELGRYMNVDPWQEKYLGWSSYNYTMGNPINFVDPDGKENVPALLWALKNMANQNIPSTYSDPYFGGSDNRWTYTIGQIPERIVCYESCFVAYLNSGDDALKTLRTGFTTKNNAFNGRSSQTGGMNWFKNGDGSDRSFTTDLSKGELGDIMFMGEAGNMQGHSVLLASDVQFSTEEVNGVETEVMSFYSLSTSSHTDSGNYGGKTYTFKKVEGEWRLNGDPNAYIFRGIGQMENIKATDEQRTEVKELIETIKANN